MSINITVSRELPSDALARVEALVALLRETDSNFVAVPIEITRGELVDGVSVSDHEDDMRGQLLNHLVEEALKDNSESIMGDLR